MNLLAAPKPFCAASVSYTHLQDEKWAERIDGMTVYTDSELRAYLEQVGFGEVQVHKNEKGWLCVTARKEEQA